MIPWNMTTVSRSVITGLDENARYYLEIHLAQLLAPPYEKCGADVEMELGKGIRPFSLCALSVAFRCIEYDMPYQVRIPHANGVLHADLSHQQAVHPSERELHKFDVL